MSQIRNSSLYCLVLLLLSACATAQSLPDGYWTSEQARPILDKTLSVRLDPDLSHLSEGEQAALGHLLAAGELFHELYLEQRHPDALAALAQLNAMQASDGSTAAELGKLFWSFKGPIATTLDNRRVAFLPVADEVPGKAVYPPSIDKATIDQFVTAHLQQQRGIFHDRSVVRESTVENLARHRATLTSRPTLKLLNPAFADSLSAITPGKPKYYAVPYAIEYADRLGQIFALLNQAADAVDADDQEFANYLRNRSRDLLHSDYEAGDASWVTGRFNNLNAQIGSYETYDDALFGVKAFYSMSILARDPVKSQALAAAIENIQAIEDALPYEHHKQVRNDIPVHVSNVIADFGQSRGTNTATILPNDAEHSRKYGRTILLRNNVMMHPALFATSANRYRAAVAPAFRDDLTIDANFQRTLWHEVGHYLGVDRTADGRSLDEALQQYSDLLEEMKSDLVSLFAARKLADAGVHTEQQLRAIYAGGVLRVLQLVKPRAEQPYQTMQLIQWNFFLDNGLLSFDPASGLLSIDYDQYHLVVTRLLREVLEIQRAGDPTAAAAFVKRHTDWRQDLHEVVATRLRNQASYRYRNVSYGALE